jgi:NitT/TauT family transport system permease protein
VSAPIPEILRIPAACPGDTGGPGWFVSGNRNLPDIPAVFAGLLTVIIIGLIVENLIFRTVERNTVQKGGTQT